MKKFNTIKFVIVPYFIVIPGQRFRYHGCWWKKRKCGLFPVNKNGTELMIDRKEAIVAFRKKDMFPIDEQFIIDEFEVANNVPF